MTDRVKGFTVTLEKDIQEPTKKVRSIAELGKRGFTFDWGKMQSNVEYFVGRNDMISMDMLWFLSKQKIQERAKQLSADVVMFEELKKDGWVIRLRPYCT